LFFLAKKNNEGQNQEFEKLVGIVLEGNKEFQHLAKSRMPNVD